MGDVFSTYDYIVSVTEVSGSESTGWTGRGYIEMSFLKLGPTALFLPLAVRFDNIHLNQCYQLLPGSKVITEFDKEWSNVVDVNGILNVAQDVKSKIQDVKAVIEVFSCLADQKASLERLEQELSTSTAKFNELQDITPAERNTLVSDLQTLINNITCIRNQCTSMGARIDAIENTCSVTNIQVTQSANAFLASSNTIIPIPDANAPKSVEQMQTRSKRYNKIKVKIRTYLPFNYVYEPPVDLSWDSWQNYTGPFYNSRMIDLANIRDYAQYQDVHLHGGFKSKQEMVFDFTNNKIIYGGLANGNLKVPNTHVLNFLTGDTKELENNSIKDQSINDNLVSSNVLKILKFKAKISTGNPAVLPAPAIDYEMTINLREDGYYTVEGTWDGFPAIEVFMEDMDSGIVDLIYESKPEYTRGEAGTEYRNGQIFKLLPIVGDERFTRNNFVGFKIHNDLEVSKYQSDVNKMLKLFKVVKNEFDRD